MVVEIQRQIGAKFYQPVWEMCHKIKSLMGLMDNKHKMRGRLEVDEAFSRQVSLKNQMARR